MLPEPKTETLPESFGVKEIISIDFHRREKDFFKDHQLDRENKKLLIARYRGASPEDKKLFKQSHCLIPLSIGQPVHYDLHLAATLSLINGTFKSCTFVLGDTLQRYTIPITHRESSNNFTEIARNIGDEWLIHNTKLLSVLDIPWRIVRWDYWLKNEKFNTFLLKIQRDYELDFNYKKAFQNNIDKYLTRVKKRDKLKVDESKAGDLCLQYLQEECAVMMLWARSEDKYQYELYSLGRGEAMQATYEKYIKPLHSDLLRPLALNFKEVSIIS